jgi:hypothetical protein
MCTLDVPRPARTHVEDAVVGRSNHSKKHVFDRIEIDLELGTDVLEGLGSGLSTYLEYPVVARQEATHLGAPVTTAKL